MPTISMFFGIIIKMYYEEHNPPHFHAEYQGFKAVYLIRTGEKIEGTYFPLRADKIIREWTFQYQNELLFNWVLMEKNKKLLKIPGADQ